MLKTDFEAFVEEQIERAANKIATGKSAKLDDVGFGRMGFYLALRRVLMGTSSAEDLGLIGAVNDALQALKLLDSDETFLGGVL
ncbi:MAG TPA: hypothetical protein VF682_19580 [Pseudomonas sp.]|jgi:hypothetical protein